MTLGLNFFLCVNENFFSSKNQVLWIFSCNKFIPVRLGKSVCITRKLYYSHYNSVSIAFAFGFTDLSIYKTDKIAVI